MTQIVRFRADRLVRDIEDAIAQAMTDNAEDLLVRSDKLSPQLSGDHVNSGKVYKRGQFLRIVGYDKPYSVWLHFARYKLGPISKLKPATSDGKVGRNYLKKPLSKNRKRYIKHVGQAIDDAVQRSAR